MKRAFGLAFLAAALVCGAAQHGGGHDQEASDGHASNTTLWKWANFMILGGAMGYGISKVAGAFFRSRTEEIRKGILEAARLREEAEARASEIDRRMADLEAEIAGLRASSSREMAAEAERIREETARHLAKIQANAEQEIASAAKQARKQLRAYSTELALDLARQKIGARLTPSLEEKLFDSFVRDLGVADRGTN